MINFDFSQYCTGCKICADVCPVHCIAFIEDIDGFIVPYVNSTLCINCHRCERICPALNKGKIEEPQTHKCYAFFHSNAFIRHIGSSGSFFYSLATSVINRGGVVYGAEMCNGLIVKHVSIDNTKDIIKLTKSKYVQSDTSGIYNSVLSEIKKNREVLFVGTPCQCSGLHNLIPSYLRDHLILVDFICHGVPSQSLFDKAINCFEIKNDCRVLDFNFREKNGFSFRNYKIVYKDSDGHIVERIDNPYTFPFYFGYLNHLISRPCCYSCIFRNIDRPSDLTIGDFWGIRRILPEINDVEKGYSVVVTNSDRGYEKLLEIRNCFIKEVPNGVNYVARSNFAYVHSDKVPPLRSLFFKHLTKKGWDYCESRYLQLYPSIKLRILLVFYKIIKLITDKIYLWVK